MAYGAQRNVITFTQFAYMFKVHGPYMPSSHKCRLESDVSAVY